MNLFLSPGTDSIPSAHPTLRIRWFRTCAPKLFPTPAVAHPPRLVGRFALICGVLILANKASDTGFPVKISFVFAGEGVFLFGVTIHIFILQN